MVKTSISPPPPERPENEALRHLNALEAIIRAQVYPSQADQNEDLRHLEMLRSSLAPAGPTRDPRATEGSGGEVLWGGRFGQMRGDERRRRSRRQQSDFVDPQTSSPGLTQLWQQVISEIAVEHRALGMLLAQQSLLVSIQRNTALVMVKQMWLPSIRRDAALIEQELRSVLRREDLQLSLKAAVADAFEDD